MNNKTTTVFAGWLKLTSEEKEEFRKEVNSFIEKSNSEKRAIVESTTKTAINLGPLGSACPCCGK